MRHSRALLSVATTVALGTTVLVSGPGTAAEGHTPRQAHKPYTVTAKANSTELVLGHRVTISGKVSPAAAGKKVTLQQKLGHKGWAKTGSATIKRSGAYRVQDRPTTLLPRKYRVVKPADARHRRGVSQKISVGVFRWHDVYDLAVRQSRSMAKSKSLSIDTVDYPESFVGFGFENGSTGFIDFNLERQCTRLRSTFGMSDEADTGSSVRIDVVGDGTGLYSGTFSLLEAQARTVDLHDVFRLGFQFESLADPASRPAIASPRVLCSF